MKFDIKTIFHRGVRTFRKHAPEICIYGGVTGMIVAGVMACGATRKLDLVLDTHREHVNELHKQYDEGDEARKREMTKLYGKTGVHLIKLYAPSAGVAVLSIGGILGGHHILQQRCVALATAYATLDAGFKQYRTRVQERFGEETEAEIRCGGHQEKIEVTEVDENGKEKKVKKSVTVVGDDEPSDYAIYFVKGEAMGAEGNPDYDMMFLRAQEKMADTILQAREGLFLNEVYDALGAPRTKAGQVVGWIRDKNDPDGGDGHVHFIIREVYRKRADDPSQYEKVLMVDFNVDGEIIERACRKGLLKG